MIIEIINNLKPDSEISENTELFDNLIDSFDLINLILEIENEYKIQIPMEDINEDVFKTVKSLQEYIAKKYEV